MSWRRPLDHKLLVEQQQVAVHLLACRRVDREDIWRRAGAATGLQTGQGLRVDLNLAVALPRGLVTSVDRRHQYRQLNDGLGHEGHRG